jgi:hypothetical protein
MPLTVPDELETKIKEVWVKSRPNHIPAADLAFDWLTAQTGLKEKAALKRLRKGVVARALHAQNHGDCSIFIEKIKRLAATLEPAADTLTPASTADVDTGNTSVQESGA